MKRLALLSLVAAFTFAAASCGNKCQTCEDPDGIADDVEICQKDYGSKTLYNLQITSFEAAGYDCD